MAQTIYTIVTTDYYEHNMGTQKSVSVRSFTNWANAQKYFRENIIKKLEELDYEAVFIPETMTKFNLWEAYKDEVEDDWFESQIIKSELD